MKNYDAGFDAMRFVVSYIVCIVVVFGTATMAVQASLGQYAGNVAFTIGVLLAATAWLSVMIVRRLKLMKVPPVNAVWLIGLHVAAPALSALPPSGLASQVGGWLMLTTAAAALCLIVYPLVSKPD